MTTRAALALTLALVTTVPAASAAPPTGSPDAPNAPPSSTARLIDVGGRKVAFHVVAGRPPAVLFESGGGMDATAWDPVLGAIHRRTGAELITFDRAGFGDSDEDPRPVQLQHEVDDLKAGLAALGVTGGLVLVAHSYGGEVATSFASENPGAIARAVLVDTNIPSFFTDEETAKMAATFPKDVEQTDKQGRAMAAMITAYPALQHGFHAMRWPDSIPAAVIVSEHPPLATPAENALWTTDHRKFAEATANRSFTIAKNSGHLVMSDRPDLVSDAVVAAIEQVRQAPPR